MRIQECKEKQMFLHQNCNELYWNIYVWQESIQSETRSSDGEFIDFRLDGYCLRMGDVENTIMNIQN